MSEHELYWGSLRPTHCEQRGDQLVICTELQAQLQELDGSVLDMFAESAGPPVEKGLMSTYRACIARSRVSMPAPELMLVFRALQRTRLELLAWAGWYCQSGPLDDLPRLGAFGAEPGIAALLVKRGIPVWTNNLTDDADQRGTYTELVVSENSAPREGPLQGLAPAVNNIYPGAQPLLKGCATSGSTTRAIRQYTRDLLGLGAETSPRLDKMRSVRVKLESQD